MDNETGAVPERIALRRNLLADAAFVGSWAVCTAACFPFVKLLTDRSNLFCAVIGAVAGLALFQGAVGIVHLWCKLGRIARERKALKTDAASCSSGKP